MHVLLDAYPHPSRAAIVAWTKAPDGSVVRSEHAYRPSFAVASDGRSLRALNRLARADPRTLATWYEEVRLYPGGPATRVLRVQPREPRRLVRLAGDLRRATHCEGYTFFDVDQKLELRWMHEKRIYPLGPVDPETLEPGPTADRYALRHPIPTLRRVHLTIELDRSDVQVQPTDPLTRITLRGGSEEAVSSHGILYDWCIPAGNLQAESEALLGLGEALRVLDPDIVLTHGGDHWGLGHLLGRIRHHGLRGRVRIGRDVDPVRPDVKAHSIHTYGQHIYRTDAWYLRGRQHIDLTKKSLESLPDRDDLHGVLYLARIAKARIQDVSRSGPGFALQQMQIDEARDMGCILPWKRNLAEDWKDAETLTRVDRGGQIHVPKPGLYEDVVAADFSAYYPSIIVARNLSSDTINCGCCPDSTHVVPDLHYHVCTQHRGHQARVLDHIMGHRKEVKALLRNAARTEEHAFAKAVKNELKGIGVCCFGYFRYRNARYGCAEVHQAIQGFGREGMGVARALAQAQGFRVLHGLTDCIFFQRPGATDAEVHRLVRGIQRAVGAPMDVEGRYRWVVFLPSRMRSNVGVPTRYYGVFQDGSLKTRGIEVRRRDTTPFVRDVQQALLDHLAEATSAKGFRARIPSALAIAYEAAKRLRAKQVPAADLVVRTTATRELGGYASRTRSRESHEALERAGIAVRPGQAIESVVLRNRGPWAQRVKPLALLDPSDRGDPQVYEALLVRAVAGILEPFGWTDERVAAYLRGPSSVPVRPGW